MAKKIVKKRKYTKKVNHLQNNEGYENTISVLRMAISEYKRKYENLLESSNKQGEGIGQLREENENLKMNLRKAPKIYTPSDTIIEFTWSGDKKIDVNDPVNHPSHYTDGKIEVIKFINDKKLNFELGNALKYICRAGKKDPSKYIEDLEKAIWYIKHEIETKLKG